MKRLTALALLCLQCFTLTADAATRYVDRSLGSDAASGLSGAPWRTIAKANSTLAATENCIIAANDTIYDAAIFPINDHTTWTGDSTNASHVTVPGANVVAKLTVFNGIKFTGAVAVQQRGCHIRNCRLVSNLFSFYGLTVLNNQIGTSENTCQFYIQPIDDAVSGDSCDIENNGMSLRYVGSPGGAHLLHWQPNRPSNPGAMKDWTVHANRCTLTITQDQNYEKTAFISRVRRSLFSDNHYTFRDSAGSLIAATGCSGTGGQAGNQTFVVRDSMKLDVFLRDTVEFKACNGPLGVCRAFIYSSGTGLPDSLNTWRYCVFKSDVSPCSGASFMQDYLWGARDSVYRNTYVCNHDGDCVKIDGALGDTAFFERNTIAQLGTGRAIKVESDDPICDTSRWPGYMRMNGNVIYSNGSDAAYVETKAVNGGLFSDYNLVYGPHLAQARAIKFGKCSAQPVYLGVPLAAANGEDTHSLWGSPRFEDSTYASFSPALGFGSAAIGAGPSGVDCGALDHVAAAPAQITDLMLGGANASAAVFTWTAPGANGNTGTASTYELRYSTVRPDETTFSGGTQVTTSSPQGVGSVEVIRVTGLTAATTYFFAIRASNGSRNGALSNVVEVHTWPVNAVSP